MVVENGRQERGRYLAGLRGFVNKIGDNLYRIKSASGNGEYVVKSEPDITRAEIFNALSAVAVTKHLALI